MRHGLGLFAVLFAGACGDSPTSFIVSSAVGDWTLTRVDGQAIPATHGSTIEGGRLSIIGDQDSGSGTIEWCANGVNVFYRLRWSSIDDLRLRLSYPEFTGAANPVDTATVRINVSGDQLTLRSRLVVQGRIAGPSVEDWTLVRLHGAGDFHC
jgi:hypothetical protein